MKNQSAKISFSLMMTVLYMCIIFFSCQSPNNNINTQNNSDSSFSDTIKITDTLNSETVFSDSTEINYFFPSPDELLGEILNSKTNFNLKYINSIKNVNKYIDIKQQALNLGVYFADLAYINIEGDKNTSLQYFETIRDLAQKIDIYIVVDEGLYTRVQNNIANKDSLNEIFNSMYSNIRDMLETSQRNNIYALVASGALIEALYISAMSVKTFDQYKPIATSIFEQRYLVNNFYDFASQYKQDQNVREVMLLLNQFITIFASADTKTSETKLVNKTKDHFVLSGGEDIIVTEANFNTFKESVIKIRQDIVQAK